MLIFSIITFVLLASLCNAQDENDIEIIVSEMDPSMEKFARGTTLLLMVDESNFTKVAEMLVDKMNAKYGNLWLVLIGTNLHTTVYGNKVVPKTMILMSYKGQNVLMVRQEVAETGNNSTNLDNQIKTARTATPTKIQSSNDLRYGDMVEFAKSVLSRDYSSCNKDPASRDIKDWCYRLISQAMVDAINARNYTDDTHYFAATVGTSNMCFSETLGVDITEYYIFTLGDIYFEIRKFTM